MYMDGSNKTLNKKFFDELAFVYDYSSNKNIVAAIAIQDGPQLIYWVITNISKKSKVKSFLFDILKLFSQVYNANNDQISTLKH